MFFLPLWQKFDPDSFTWQFFCLTGWRWTGFGCPMAAMPTGRGNWRCTLPTSTETYVWESPGRSTSVGLCWNWWRNLVRCETSNLSCRAYTAKGHFSHLYFSHHSKVNLDLVPTDDKSSMDHFSTIVCQCCSKTISFVIDWIWLWLDIVLFPLTSAPVAPCCCSRILCVCQWLAVF